MNKIIWVLVLICAILLFACKVAYDRLEYEINQKNIYKGNNYALISEIKKRNEKEMETNIRMQEIERLANEETKKGYFDWNADISNSIVIRKLQNY